MTAPLIGSIVLFFVLIAIAIEVHHLRTRKATQRRRKQEPPRRQQHVEQEMARHFDGPHRDYGILFKSFSIWRRTDETQLEIVAAEPWRKLNAFTQSLVLRHLWRALVGIVRRGNTSIVVADEGQKPVYWTQTDTERFNDRGSDPWANGKASGTLISGRESARK